MFLSVDRFPNYSDRFYTIYGQFIYFSDELNKKCFSRPGMRDSMTQILPKNVFTDQWEDI